MNRALLVRSPSTDQGTFGELSILEQHGTWNTLELPWRANGPHYSCIPPGMYRCQLQPTGKWSPRPDGKLFEVMDVAGRSEIKLHAATWAGDVTKGWCSQLLGCIAIGKAVGHLVPPELDHAQAALLLSRPGLREFMQLVGDEPFALEIRWGTHP